MSPKRLPRNPVYEYQALYGWSRRWSDEAASFTCPRDSQIRAAYYKGEALSATADDRRLFFCFAIIVAVADFWILGFHLRPIGLCPDGFDARFRLGRKVSQWTESVNNR
jgi:hypothetical protein